MVDITSMKVNNSVIKQVSLSNLDTGLNINTKNLMI